MRETVPLSRVFLLAAALSALTWLGTALWYYSLPITRELRARTRTHARSRPNARTRAVVSANSTIFQSDPAFVYLFSMFFLRHKLQPVKAAAVVLSIAGVALVSFGTPSKSSGGQKSEFIGYVYDFLSMICFALFQVCAHAHLHTHAHARTRTHAHTHTHTHACTLACAHRCRPSAG